MRPDARFAAELPQQLRSLRRLAAALVGPDAADDVLQETALQALRSPPGRGGAFGGWLAGVLRNVARHHRRGEARRRRREAAVAEQREAAAQDVTDQRPLAEVETLQALTRGLAGLPEPYRQALVWRYLHERAPAAIARDTGEPLATVKTRLKRGLQLLRERLASELGPRDWRARLAAAIGLEAAAGLGAAAIGTGGIMATAKGWWGGALAVALVGGLVWWQAATGVAPPVPAALPAPDGGPHRVAGALAAAAPASPPPAEAVRAVALPTAPAAAQALLVGRCVGDQRQPLARVPLQLRGQLRLGSEPDADDQRLEAYRVWLAAYPTAPWRDLDAESAADGTFALPVPAAPLRLVLRLRHDGLEREVDVPALQPGTRTDLGDLWLPRACAVQVRAVDERGAAVPTAPILLLREARSPTAPPLRLAEEQVRSTGDGVVATVTAGTWRVLVTGHEVVAGATCDVPVGTAAFAHTVVVQAPADAATVAGRVADLDGQPLAEVEVVGLAQGSTFARTGADGRFVLPRLGLPGDTVDLRLRRDGYAFASGRLQARWGDRDLALAMRPLAALRVRVLDDLSGAPLRDVIAYRWLDPQQPTAGLDNFQRECVEGADAAGELVCRGAVPGHHLLVVESLAGTHARSALHRLEVAPGRPNRVEIRLRRSAVRQLQVVAGDGAPVAGAAVELLPADGPLQTGRAGVELVSLPRWAPRLLAFPHVVWQRTRTDAAGVCELRGDGEVPVVVRVSAPGRPPLVAGPERLVAGGPWQVALVAGTEVRLRLGPAAFLAAFGDLPALPGFGGAAPPPGFRLVRGSGRQALAIPARAQPPLQPDADGELAFAAVPPGAWSLVMDWRESCAGEAVFAVPRSAAVAVLQVPPTGRLELPVDLREWLPVDVQVTVVQGDQPAARQSLQFAVERPDAAGAGTLLAETPVVTDARGCFRFRGRAGTVWVEVVAGAGGAAGPRRSSAEVLVPGDRREVVLALPQPAGR